MMKKREENDGGKNGGLKGKKMRIIEISTK